MLGGSVLGHLHRFFFFLFFLLSHEPIDAGLTFMVLSPACDIRACEKELASRVENGSGHGSRKITNFQSSSPRYFPDLGGNWL